MSPHDARVPDTASRDEPTGRLPEPAASEHPVRAAHAPSGPDDGPTPASEPRPGAVRTGTLGGQAPSGGAPGGASSAQGRTPTVEDPVAASAWEEEPPRVPVFRWRLVGGAVMVLVVAVAAWWAVTWLMRPSPPPSVPVAAQTLAEAGGADTAEADAGDDAAAADGGEGPSSGRGTGEEADGPQPQGERAEEADGETAQGADAARVRVHVIGEVRSPGVLTVPADARTADAIAAAGGPTRDAQAERINLAAPLIDGQQVLVPGPQTTEEQLESVQAQAHAGPAGRGAEGDAGAGQVPAAGAAGTSADGRAADGNAAGGAEDGADGSSDGSVGTVDLNAADGAVLQTLPGVGPATAEKIIAHREQVGPFQSLTDLDAVSGIGPATLERLAPLVTW